MGSSSDSEDRAWDMLGIYKLCKTSSFEEMFCRLISFNTMEREGDGKGGEGRGGWASHMLPMEAAPKAGFPAHSSRKV